VSVTSVAFKRIWKFLKNARKSGVESVGDFLNRDAVLTPDLFLLDVMLPDGFGVEVCNLSRSSGTDGHKPIVIMSAHASYQEISRSCQANEFINKPFDIDSFVTRIRKLTTADLWANPVSISF
jgi:DNA-binding response OmpR family regulator